MTRCPIHGCGARSVGDTPHLAVRHRLVEDRCAAHAADISEAQAAALAAYADAIRTPAGQLDLAPSRRL